MEKTDTVFINWYNQGIAVSEAIDKNILQNKKRELSNQGITYWITGDSSQSTQQVHCA